MTITASSLAAFNEAAAAFVKALHPKEAGATLVTLSGELGAGKTAFVKAVAGAFGIDADVTSPTFVLMKSYPITNGAFKTLVHIDAYRLKNGGELSALRFHELLQDTGNLILLEWPEKVPDGLPPADASISIRTLTGEERELSYA
jgi:tRNA threonylcarbamoyladenosine biosynthesis protein TsaE